MRLVVFSDSHGNFAALNRMLAAQPEADMFLHCGDGDKEVDDLQALYPQKRILFVRGNCDWGSSAKDDELITVAGKRIFFTHGHGYDVKRGYDKLTGRAKALGADIACFGHTHLPLSIRREGLHLVNPGSIGNPYSGALLTYATIDISGEGFAVNIIEL